MPGIKRQRNENVSAVCFSFNILANKPLPYYNRSKVDPRQTSRPNPNTLHSQSRSDRTIRISPSFLFPSSTITIKAGSTIFAVSPFLPFSSEDARQPLYWLVHGYPFTYPVPPAFLHSLSTPIRGAEAAARTSNLYCIGTESHPTWTWTSFVNEASRESREERRTEREREEKGEQREVQTWAALARGTPGNVARGLTREDLSVGSCQAAESIIRVTSWYTSVCIYTYIYIFTYICVMYVVSIRDKLRRIVVDVKWLP